MLHPFLHPTPQADVNRVLMHFVNYHISIGFAQVVQYTQARPSFQMPAQWVWCPRRTCMLWSVVLKCSFVSILHVYRSETLFVQSLHCHEMKPKMHMLSLPHWKAEMTCNGRCTC